MYLILKAALLLVFILFILPIIFFLLVGLFGKFFSIRIQHNPFAGKMDRRFLKNKFD